MEETMIRYRKTAPVENHPGKWWAFGDNHYWIVDETARLAWKITKWR